MKGWGPKSSVCLSKHSKTRLFGRDIPGFLAGCPGGLPEKFEKKICVQFPDRVARSVLQGNFPATQ